MAQWPPCFSLAAWPLTRFMRWTAVSFLPALRDGDWKYLRVDGNDCLFDIPADERERANRARTDLINPEP